MEVWVLGHRLRRSANATSCRESTLNVEGWIGLEETMTTFNWFRVNFIWQSHVSKKKDMALASSSLHISQFAKSAKGCAAGLRPQCQTLDFYEKLGTSMKFLFGDFNARIDSHALLTIPGSYSFAGAWTQKFISWHYKKHEKILWGTKLFYRCLFEPKLLYSACWLCLSAAERRQMDGFPPSCFRRILQIQFALISRGPMQKPYVGHYDGIAMPTCSFR